jgi:hypothetical protein
MAVQRATQEEAVEMPSWPPSPRPSAQDIQADVHTLTSRDAGTTQDSEFVDDLSTESWAFFLVLWLDFMADLIVAFALFQRPTLQPLFDRVITTSIRSEQVQRCQLCVKGIGVQYESAEALADVFRCFGAVESTEIHNEIAKDGVTDTSWAILTMADNIGKQAVLDAKGTLPESITVTDLMAREEGAAGVRNTWVWRKAAEILLALCEVMQSCVAPDRHAKNRTRTVEQVRCICALPLGIVVSPHWITTVRLLRLAHVPRAAAIGTKWVQQAALHYATVNILRAIILLMLLSHWLGCGFLSMLRHDPHASEWMPSPCYASAQDQYICGVYWAFGTLTSNISFEPHSGRQRVLTILAWCGGLLLYGSILSSLVRFVDITTSYFFEDLGSYPSFAIYIVVLDIDLWSPTLGVSRYLHFQTLTVLHRHIGNIWTPWRSTSMPPLIC